MAETKPRVLFLRTHNAARSQMAEALLRRYAGDRVEVASAGLEPADVYPFTRCVLAERRNPRAPRSCREPPLTRRSSRERRARRP